jgi:hypothetical protein
MTISFPFKDCHGNDISLGQRVALKVERRSGSWGSYFRPTNLSHRNSFWLAGSFNWDQDELRLYFIPDKDCEEALCHPMGKERIKQTVDYVNLDYNDPSNIDAVDVPAKGTFREIF